MAKYRLNYKLIIHKGTSKPIFVYIEKWCNRIYYESIHAQAKVYSYTKQVYSEDIQISIQGLYE